MLVLYKLMSYSSLKSLTLQTTYLHMLSGVTFCFHDLCSVEKYTLILSKYTWSKIVKDRNRESLILVWADTTVEPMTSELNFKTENLVELKVMTNLRKWREKVGFFFVTVWTFFFQCFLIGGKKGLNSTLPDLCIAFSYLLLMLTLLNNIFEFLMSCSRM